MAIKVVNRPEIPKEMSEKGLPAVSLFSISEGRTYCLMKCGINRRPGIIRNAGNVIRLKMPKTTTSAKIAEVKAEDFFFWGICQPCSAKSGEDRTLVSTILWIKTRLQATANVSIEFENVWVW